MKSIKRGINIGDHFENTPKPGVEFENPIKEWYYDLIKGLGFDHIRLPAKWSAHSDDHNKFKIDERFAQMVEDTVDRFISLDMTVILNIHHFREAADDPESQYDKLCALWDQIALRFKDKSDYLIFEVMNEPRWNVDAKIWNRIQNDLVGIIRKSNPTRTVMIGGIDYNGIYALKDMVPPKDDQNILATFHYYFPLEFTHQGASWSPTYTDISDIKWMGTDDEINDVKNGMLHAKAWMDKYNLPMNLGEFGAYSKGDIDSRVRWTKCVREAAEELGISWSYWEFNRGFGICEKEKPEVIQPLVDALLKD